MALTTNKDLTKKRTKNSVQTPNTVIECPICKLRFLHNQGFIDHAANTCFQDQLKDYLDPKALTETYRCPECSSKLKNQRSLICHFGSYHKMVVKYLNEQAGISNSFDEFILKKFEIQQGIRTNKIGCPICKKEFFTENTFLKHAVFSCFNNQIQTDLPSAYLYQCPDCSASFETLFCLIFHYGIDHNMVIKYLNEEAGIPNCYDDSILKRFEIQGPLTDKNSDYVLGCSRSRCRFTCNNKEAFLKHLTKHFKRQLSANLPLHVSYKCPHSDCSLSFDHHHRELISHYAFYHKMIFKYLNEHVGISNSYDDSVLKRFEIQKSENEENEVEMIGVRNVQIKKEYYDVGDSFEASKDSFDLKKAKKIKREDCEMNIKVEVKSEPEFSSIDIDMNNYNIDVKREIKVEPVTF